MLTSDEELVSCRISGSHSGGPKSSTFWNITQHMQLKVSRRFGGIRRLYIPQRRLTFNGLHGILFQKTRVFKLL
jgi:hypothetical protein